MTHWCTRRVQIKRTMPLEERRRTRKALPKITTARASTTRNKAKNRKMTEIGETVSIRTITVGDTMILEDVTRHMVRRSLVIRILKIAITEGMMTTDLLVVVEVEAVAVPTVTGEETITTDAIEDTEVYLHQVAMKKVVDAVVDAEEGGR